MRWVCATLMGLALGGVALADENWPQFLGPMGNNHSTATNLPATWSEDENIAWKTPIHDSGWSSPVIWGNQIWLTTATDDGKKSFAVCVDKETGKILHDLPLWDNLSPEDTRQYNSFASPTPVLEEGRVYVHFGSYGTACLDMRSGDTLWSRRDLPCRHYRGPGSSPILFENLLIVHLDGYDHQYVVALDKRTGHTVWKKDREIDYGTDDGDSMKAFSTPTILTAGGRLQMVSATAKAVLSYDPRTGDELWRVRYKEHSVAGRPMFGHGLVFLSTGFGKASLLAIKPDGTGDVTNSHIAWTAPQGVPSEPSPILVDDLLYMVHDKGTAQALEAKTGQEAWSARIGGNFSATPLYADGKIYVTNHQGTTTVFAPGREFQKLGTSKLDAGTHATPAAVGSAIYFRTDTHLYRIEK